VRRFRHRESPARWLRRCAVLCNAIVCNVIVAMTVLCWADYAVGQEAVYRDDEVKAAFLYHFATFVQWPETSQTGEVFSVAVLGADDIVAELERFLPGREIQGRPIKVRRLRSLAQLGDAAVLFIGATQNSQLPHLIRKVQDRPMLVVTEAPGALKAGSTINFRIVDDRVRFEISLIAAERAGLVLSSRLLSAAMFVDTTSAIQPPAAVVFASSGSGARYH
jgi:hypothetical protein